MIRDYQALLSLGKGRGCWCRWCRGYYSHCNHWQWLQKIW